MRLRDLGTTLVCAAAFAIDPSLRILLREDPRAQLEALFQAYNIVTLGVQHAQSLLT